jgi:hypothetical protein
MNDKRQTPPNFSECARTEQGRNCKTVNKYLVMNPSWGLDRKTY